MFLEHNRNAIDKSGNSIGHELPMPSQNIQTKPMQKASALSTFRCVINDLFTRYKNILYTKSGPNNSVLLM